MVNCEEKRDSMLVKTSLLRRTQTPHEKLYSVNVDTWDDHINPGSQGVERSGEEC